MSCFLQLGSKNDTRITTLERKLKTLGYYKGVIEADKGKTPYYGPLLSQAVQSYQKKKGLQVDCVGPITWKSLFGNTSSTTSTSNTSSSSSTGSYEGCKNTTLKKGSTGACVTYAQIKLKAWGLYTRQVDGDYGDYTVTAVKTFQELTGHTQDGVLGPKTWSSFLTYSTTSSSSTSFLDKLRSALGSNFTNDKELAKAFQNHPDYEYYLNDKKDEDEELAALKVVGGAGVNCVDVSQVVRKALIALGFKNVNIWRGKFKCGGHIWVTYGSNNTVFDAAGMMKWGYGIGKYMCSGTPTELVKNPAWLLSDDGRT